MSYNETLEREFLRNIPQQGKVEWIGIRPKRMAKVHSVNEVLANPDTGLEGDHFKKSSTGKRQVTLIQQEHLDVMVKY
jgi:MOSC domain-containing protein YiiM